MKQEQNVRILASKVLERTRMEYSTLLQSDPVSLEKMIAPENFNFGDFCQDFAAHPQGHELKKDAEAFGQQYGTWLANSRHYISCAWYLYPTGGFERVLGITKNLSLGFYLNDVMGRDVFKSLSSEQQQASREMIENMSLVDDTLIISSSAHPLESANAEILRDFKDNSPKDWFARFLKVYCYHLNITHRDRSVETLGYIPDIYEYMDIRCYYAAVHHLVLWIEYSTGHFLDWEMINRTNFSQRLQRLHWIIAAFPALANDLFSFETEVIDYGCDSNMIMVLALNGYELSLQDSIMKASEIVRNLVMEILATIDYIKREVAAISRINPDLSGKLSIHLEGIVRFVQAGWLWQVHTNRYKRTASIWAETSLKSAPVSSPV